MDSVTELARKWGMKLLADDSETVVDAVATARKLAEIPLEYAAKPVVSGLQWVGDKLSRTDYALGGAAREAIDWLYYGDKETDLLDVLGAAGKGLKGEERQDLMALTASPRYGEYMTNLLRGVELMGASGLRTGEAIGRQFEEAKAAREANPELAEEVSAILADPGQTGARKVGALGSTALGREGYLRTETAVPALLEAFGLTVATNPLTWVTPQAGGRALSRATRLFRKGMADRGAATNVANAVIGAIERDFQPLRNAPKVARAQAAKGVAMSQLDDAARAIARAEEIPEAARLEAGLGKTLADEVAGFGDYNQRLLDTAVLNEAISGTARGHAAAEVPPEVWKTGVRAIDDVMEQARLVGETEANKLAAEFAKVKLPPAKRLTAALSQFEKTGEVTPDAKTFLNVIEKWRNEIWPGQLARAGGTPIRATEYLPHGRGVGSPFKPGFALHRTLSGTLAEKGLHPAETAYMRTASGAAADFARNALDDLARKLGKKVAVPSADDIARGGDEVMSALKRAVAKPAGHEVVAVAEGAGAPGAAIFERVESVTDAAQKVADGRQLFHVPSEFVDFSERYAKVLAEPGVGGAYRKYLSFWKPSQLGVYSGYWQRNLGTEYFWNYLRSTDVLTPRYWTNAMNIIRGKPGAFTTRSGIKIPYDVIRSGPLKRLQHQGMMAAESLAESGTIARSPMQRAVRPATWMMEKLSPLYEDHPRMMQFLYEIDDLPAAKMNFDKAVKTVHDFHINYSAISPWMKKWGLTIFPFARFPVGATKILARETIRQPGKIHAATDAMRLFELIAGERAGTPAPPEEYIPEFLRGQDPLYLSQTAEGRDRFFPQQNCSPLGQFSELFGYGKGINPWMSATGPLGTGVGILSNKNWFTGEDISRLPGERETFLGMNMDPAVVYGLGALPFGRAASELNRLNPGNIFGTTEKPSWAGITRKYPQPSGKARLATFIFGGRIYESDRDLQRIRYLSGIVDTIREYNRLQSQIGTRDMNPTLWDHYEELKDALREEGANSPFE